ncbi:putative HTH-type transcriptional regulator y4dL [Nymphon striatum]|nr:putative HTH-type transcriptional regulator y4dL [Nymphon striatum]
MTLCRPWQAFDAGGRARGPAAWHHSRQLANGERNGPPSPVPPHHEPPDRGLDRVKAGDARAGARCGAAGLIALAKSGKQLATLVIYSGGRTAMKHLVRTSKNLGHAIRQARKAKNLTQTELAAMSGVWQETISKIENGSGGTKLETLFDLVAALDLEITVTERSKGTSDGLEDIF